MSDPNDLEVKIEETDTPANEPSESELLMNVRQDYEAKIADIKQEYETKLAERERLIRQILANGEPKQVKSIADEINERRASLFKKW